MELRQLRYFVRTVELGSIARAADDLHTVASALSQQISRLECSLSTRLLERTARGVVPTAAGLEFFREAQLSLRHADQAMAVAQETRGSGRVSIGMASSTASLLGLPLLRSMHERYPDVRLHLIEGPTGHLASMLNARQIDLAVLFDVDAAWRWSVLPLIEERIYLIERADSEPIAGDAQTITMADLKEAPLIVPSPMNGLRRTLDRAFARAGVKPRITAEIDSLGMLLDALENRTGATLQAWGALARVPDAQQRYRVREVEGLVRVNSLCCLSDDELPVPAIGARIILAECVRELVRSGRWLGGRSTLHDS